MRLSTLIPSLSPELVSSLEVSGIRTDADLLFKPIFELYRQLPVETGISLADLENAVALTAQLAAASGTSGDELLTQCIPAEEKAATLFSGVKGLDDLLGGFGGRRVIEISGDRQSGKTTLALNIILRHLAESSQARVVWIDTTGDFSAEHAAHLLENFSSESPSTALDRLQVSLAFDIEAAYSILDEVRNSFATTGDTTTVSCIVIDAITPLLGPLLSSVSAHGHSVMTEFGYHLRSFSQTHSCPMLIINNTVLIPNSTSTHETRRPALGPSFTFMTDALLWLSRADEDIRHENPLDYTIRSAKVLRSKNTPPKAQCTFKIIQGIISAYK